MKISKFNNISKIKQLILGSSYYENLINNDEYFNNLIVEDPILKKSDIQQFGQQILNKKYKNIDLNLLNIARTSGSTGEPLEVFWNADDLMKSNLCLWRLRKKLHGINSSSKYASFHSIIYNKSKPLKTEKVMIINGGVNISFSKFHLHDNDLIMYFEKMEEFCPEWMLIQPSIAFRLMEFLQLHNMELPKTVKYIELNGEMISFEDENILKNFFNIPIANMYGCSELNAIGYECLHGNMHILTSNVLLQLYNAEFDKTGISGYVIISSLHNSVFPLIGYDLGDKIHLSFNNNCPCGNNSPIIDKIYGRKADEIVLKTGEKVNPFLFTYCVETVNSMLGNPIKQFKVLHNNDDIIILFIRIDPSFNNWKSTISSELISVCNQEFRTIIPISIQYTNKPIEISKNGKYNLIERKKSDE